MNQFSSSSQIPRWRFGLVAVVGAAALGVAFTRTSAASDHEDAPSLVADKAADIADVYAFMRPGGATHMVLGMTVNPGATATTTFDPSLEYVFHVIGYDGTGGVLDPTVNTKVTCRFEPPAATGQVVLCSANGMSAFTKVGAASTTDAGDRIRIFAGLRADPAYGDVAALKSTLANKQLKFADAGTNTFAGKNVLAIVLEVDVDNVLLAGVDASGVRPQLAVTAETSRVPQ